MINNISEISELFISKSIKIINKRLNEVLKKYSFHYLSKKIDFEKNNKILEKIKESKIIIINNYTDSKTNILYFIISFNKTILIINQSSINYIRLYLENNRGLEICFLSNTKEIFDKFIQINYTESQNEDYFNEEIKSFNQNLLLHKPKECAYNEIWTVIRSCISGYLIKQGYLKLNKDRIKKFCSPKKNLQSKEKTKTMNEDEFIEMRVINGGTFCSVSLVYHIEKEKLYVMKKMYYYDETNPYLFQREKENYSIIKHPFIPKFYGTIENKNHLIIEFINGRTLLEIEKLHLNDEEKFTIIFQLFNVFRYLHKQHFIYRDLKPNNIIIDQNKNLVLIDFDRMINADNDVSNTTDLSTIYGAPEIGSKQFTNKNDIYSIGQIIYFIINEKKPMTDELQNCFVEFEKYPEMKQIYENCTNNNFELRPSISKLKDFLYKIVVTKSFVIKRINPKDLTRLGLYYEAQNDYQKAIEYFELAANYNDIKAQSQLGSIYSNGTHVKRDINKSIHYYSLAASQNDKESLLALGDLYLEGPYNLKDIDKAIHYYTVSSDLNDSIAQFYLGLIYSLNKYNRFDIKKAIHYLTLSANQNNKDALYHLGYIYLKKKDINKLIYYLTLAANQNHIEAQYYLGLLYYTNKNIKQDVTKSLHYLTLAANQNHVEAQALLGLIYMADNNVKIDINKSFYYLNLAANQNDAKAKYALGLFYYSGKFGPKNIEKSIEYLTFAADHNISEAQVELANILYERDHRPHNMSKIMHYLTLASNLNNVEAQYKLGAFYFVIYSDYKKSFHYLELAAQNNHPYAQYYIGLNYYRGFGFEKNINKGISYLMESSCNNNYEANFAIGFIYHEGKYVNRDIKKSIHFYKQASSFNHNNAKNNLGILYKYGFDGIVQRNIANAKFYFEEAINQKSDYVAMYNLAHILIYEEKSIDKSISLLINSYNLGFYVSIVLLCLSLIKKYGVVVYKFREEIQNCTNKTNLILSQLIDLIDNLNLNIPSNFDEMFQQYSEIDFLYDITYETVLSKSLFQQQGQKKSIEIKSKYQVDSNFYKGFGEI